MSGETPKWSAKPKKKRDLPKGIFIVLILYGETRESSRSCLARSGLCQFIQELRQVIHVTGAVGLLGRRCRRCHPWRIREVEIFRHGRLSRVSLREGGKIEARFNELEDRRHVSNRVRHLVLFCKRRNDNQRHAIPGVIKIAERASACNRRANIVGQHIYGLDAIGTDGRLRRYVVVESSAFVIGKWQQCFTGPIVCTARYFAEVICLDASKVARDFGDRRMGLRFCRSLKTGPPFRLRNNGEDAEN